MFSGAALIKINIGTFTSYYPNSIRREVQATPDFTQPKFVGKGGTFFQVRSKAAKKSVKPDGEGRKMGGWGEGLENSR